MKEQTVKDAKEAPTRGAGLDNFTKQDIVALVAERVDVLVPLVCRDSWERPMYLYPYQTVLVDGVLNHRDDWQLYLWPTGCGKTHALSIALGLVPIFRPGRDMVNISYTEKQAKLIFDAVKTMSLSSPALAKCVDRNQPFTNEEMNWTTNTSLICRTANANNKGEGLLGLHKPVISIDESCSILDEIYNEKIDRITAPEGMDRLLLEITTTHKRNHVYDSTQDPDCRVHRVTWREGVAAGRFTKEFIDRRKRRLGESLFRVWYECQFPSMDEDALFDPDWVAHAIELGKLAELPAIFKEP